MLILNHFKNNVALPTSRMWIFLIGVFISVGDVVFVVHHVGVRL